MGPHGGTFKGPPPGDKKIQGSKKADYQFKIKMKKTFLGTNIRQKEIILEPHRGPFKGLPQGEKTKIEVKRPITAAKLKSKKLL